MKILFTGGGTGGHIFPLIAIAREIRRLYSKKIWNFIIWGQRRIWADFAFAGRF